MFRRIVFSAESPDKSLGIARVNSFMRRETLLFFVILASFFVFYPARIGQPRGIEQFMATVNNEPSVFIQDEFAACLIYSVNTVIPAIISKTNLTERKIIYFIEVFLVLFFLFHLA